MLKSITSFIQDKVTQQKEDIDEEHLMHLAAATLLLEVSRADFEIQEEELNAISHVFKERFNFSNKEVENLIHLARTEQDKHVSIYPFVKIINDSCSPVEKKALMIDLWKIAFADSKLDKYEEYQIRKIADLLYVPHSLFIQTKLQVLEE